MSDKTKVHQVNNEVQLIVMVPGDVENQETKTNEPISESAEKLV